MKVFVSDEIAESVDISQFYEDTDGADGISVSLKMTSQEVSGPVSKMKVVDRDPEALGGMIETSFICDGVLASLFILNQVDTISLYTGDDKILVREYSNFKTVSKYFELLENRKYECSIIVELFNT